MPTILNATPVLGDDPAALLWLGVLVIVLALGGIWADRVDRRNPR
jgi:hypothetical protein